MTDNKDTPVLVLGAGVVGTAVAYALNRAGRPVTVVDRQPGPGLETSFANGGQIAPAHATPWANPRTLPKLIHWLGRSDAPLLFRWRPDPGLWAWGGRFLRNTTPGRTRRNLLATLQLALYSRERLGEWRAREELVYDGLQRGILHIYRRSRDYAQACREAALMQAHGLDRTPRTVAEAVALEPALADAAPTLAGALYSPGDESGDAHAFTRQLAAVAQAQGAVFHFGAAIARLEARPGEWPAAVLADGTRLTAPDMVVALGPESPRLLRPLGIALPIQPAKGYSVTVPLEETAVAPTVSITDDEHKMVFSRLGARLRAAGTAAFDGWDWTLEPARVRLTLDNTRALFPRLGSGLEAAEPWCGLRPKTPDSVPILGPSGRPGLWLATGHGTLGWTMACGTGQLLADALSGRPTALPLAPYHWRRFR